MANKLKGKIISDKMDKTVVVEIERVKKHPLYKKRIKVHKKYKAHDEKNAYKEGDNVVIEECSPMSKDKHFKIVGKVEDKSKK
jgi:small subunit ribosomal protein S17